MRFRFLAKSSFGPIVILLLSSLVFSNCKPDTNSSATKNAFSLDDTLSWGVEEIDLDILLLPPADLMVFISDMELKSELTNPPENILYYTDIRSKSINFGVYMADIIYLSMNNDIVSLPKYYKAIKRLAVDLRIENVISDDLIERLSTNIHNQDSLYTISRAMQDSFVSTLDYDNRENILTIVSLGIFIESLYLTVENIDDIKYFNDLSTEILNQKIIFEQYYAYAEYFVQDENIADIIVELQPLKMFFNNLEIKQIEKIIKKDSNNHFLVTGGADLKFTPEDLNELKLTVGIIRKQLVRY